MRAIHDAESPSILLSPRRSPALLSEESCSQSRAHNPHPFTLTLNQTTMATKNKGVPAGTVPPSPALSGNQTPFLGADHPVPKKLAILTSGGDCSGMVSHNELVRWGREC